MYENIKAPYKDIYAIFSTYWKIYGGWRAFLLSPYLHGSLLIAFLSYPAGQYQIWSDLPLDILPNLIGFSLGGYAIFLALGDDGFKKTIAGKIEDENFEPSPYIHANTTFLHFIIIQIMALMLSLVLKITNGRISYFIENSLIEKDLVDIFLLPISVLAYWFFLYAIILTLAATIELYRLAGWYDEHAEEENQNT